MIKLQDTFTPACRIHRIPFQHPSSIFSILTLIRLQLSFNELFSSIFTYGHLTGNLLTLPLQKKSSSLDTKKEDVAKTRQFTVQCVSPAKLQIELLNPQDKLEISLAMNAPTQPLVKIDHVNLSGKADQVLQLCKNLAIFTRWLDQQIK